MIPLVVFGELTFLLPITGVFGPTGFVPYGFTYYPYPLTSYFLGAGFLSVRASGLTSWLSADFFLPPLVVCGL